MKTSPKKELLPGDGICGGLACCASAAGLYCMGMIGEYVILRVVSAT